jgi:H+-transporting ATPase
MFLGYFWGPMPVMIWVAIIIELAKALITRAEEGGPGEGWEDFAVLLFLQFANAIVGFVEENAAGDAIDALKNALKPFAYVKRDGAFSKVAARELVPGDLIEVKLGDVMPADSILLDGHGQLQMDQAALTGESLPVEKYPWEMLLMGSAVKRGEAFAMVADTGLNTFFGKAAGLIASVNATGHLQVVLLKVTVALLVVSVLLCAAIFARLMTYAPDAHLITDGGHNRVMSALSVVIVILVASIPIAIEVVCTSTLAVGSHKMAAMKVIVARLSAIEQLASMSILCSDKTGTLTKNQLALNPPALNDIGASAALAERILFWAYLASKHDKGSQDAIDKCLGDALEAQLPAQFAELAAYKLEHFEPFNPTTKRTLAHLVAPDGAYLEVSKGAPHKIMDIAWNEAAIHKDANAKVQALADRGFRALGVAVNAAGRGRPAKWEYLGALSLFDPPRDDTKATIEAARKFHIEVKMVTGDHTAIAKETCRQLGMGTNILNTTALGTVGGDQSVVDIVIRDSHGFAEVMPEHKFLIVERLMKQGFMTGMTGDGVNDAPALKRADVGIAVEGATDAARAAADLVLTEPGLSVIIDAVFESRKIFQRMRNYIVYRIACTVQLLLFFFFAVMAVDPQTEYMYGSSSATLARVLALNGTAPSAYDFMPAAERAHFLGAVCDGNDAGATLGTEGCHGNAFTLPVISMVLITILNDGCMITTSTDYVEPDEFPQEWQLFEVTAIAMVLGLVACVSSLILVAYLMHANFFHPGDFMGNVFGSAGRNYVTWFEVRTILYLKVSISDFLTLFSARTRGWFWERALSRPLAIAAAVALTLSTIFALFWGDIFHSLPGAYMASLRFSRGAAAATWLYCILWWFVQDAAKVWAVQLMAARNAKRADIEEFVKRDEEPPKPASKPATPAGSIGRHGSIGSQASQKTYLPRVLPPGVTPADLLKAANLEQLTQMVRVKPPPARRPLFACAAARLPRPTPSHPPPSHARSDKGRQAQGPRGAVSEHVSAPGRVRGRLRLWRQRRAGGARARGPERVGGRGGGGSA